MKTLYTFSVNHGVSATKTESSVNEKGETVTVQKQVTEEKPFAFAIKRPSRMEREEGELIRAAALRYYVEERGLMTQAALRKKYGDAVGINANGGVYTEQEEKTYLLLMKRFQEVTEEYQAAKANGLDEAKTDALFDEFLLIQNRLTEFQNSANIFYRDTAEAKSQEKLIEYYVLFMTYFSDNNNEDLQKVDWKPFFQGKTLDEKLAYLDSLEEKDDALYLRVRDELTLITTILLKGGVNSEEVDFLRQQYS